MGGVICQNNQAEKMLERKNYRVKRERTRTLTTPTFFRAAVMDMSGVEGLGGVDATAVTTVSV